ncbi:hypothetical protein DFH27DRAFT_326020 [Peziza echinospora]|nr:hypothetical protein DFH27DRAFT_326020 [Peziza echinospora]
MMEETFDTTIGFFSGSSIRGWSLSFLVPRPESLSVRGRSLTFEGTAEPTAKSTLRLWRPTSPNAANSFFLSRRQSHDTFSRNEFISFDPFSFTLVPVLVSYRPHLFQSPTYTLSPNQLTCSRKPIHDRAHSVAPYPEKIPFPKHLPTPQPPPAISMAIRMVRMGLRLIDHLYHGTGLHPLSRAIDPIGHSHDHGYPAIVQL